nr:MAG TPA: hypothetical protein [Caudoviricetes sp.]
MENPPDNTHLDTSCIGCSPCPMARQHHPAPPSPTDPAQPHPDRNILPLPSLPPSTTLSYSPFSTHRLPRSHPTWLPIPLNPSGGSSRGFSRGSPRVYMGRGSPPPDNPS